MEWSNGLALGEIYEICQSIWIVRPNNHIDYDEMCARDPSHEYRTFDHVIFQSSGHADDARPYCPFAI